MLGFNRPVPIRRSLGAQNPPKSTRLNIQKKRQNTRSTKNNKNEFLFFFVCSASSIFLFCNFRGDFLGYFWTPNARLVRAYGAHNERIGHHGLRKYAPKYFRVLLRSMRFFRVYFVRCLFWGGVFFFDTFLAFLLSVFFSAPPFASISC